MPDIGVSGPCGKDKQMLREYAARENLSRGRLYREDESRFRTCFQRDRDRIIHSSAFRRLKHKTQVFIEHEGDYYRTRMTHSIEVAQVARTVATALGLNEELTEAVALAHDLGHPPFGHAGEGTLQHLMEPFGGFDHNAQAIRIVTSLERHYAGFDGLNLTWETLEGIAKHNGPVTGEIPYALSEYNERHDLELDTYASLEAQVAALADDIAYCSHDLHDGLRAGLFTTDEIDQLPLIEECFSEVDHLYPRIDRYRRQHEALRRFFGLMVEDLIDQSARRLDELSPISVSGVRQAGQPVVNFSESFQERMNAIRAFLFDRMYRAPDVLRMRRKVKRAVEALFPMFITHTELLPEQWHRDVEAAGDETAVARIVVDYISGMTDRFALQEYMRLCG